MECTVRNHRYEQVRRTQAVVVAKALKQEKQSPTWILGVGVALSLLAAVHYWVIL